ncbi:MAG TPA: TIGR03621 family F420-dependent LLM class oxidoreductase [Candidatus Limnocylindria bacterium]|nr:TIGR03621 family F420-dependent LLM class oxidoreductase [Candidatus Limnocylindria bacterium]
MARPFRFGLLIETGQTTRAALLELARRAEGIGCSIILGTDHFGRLAALPLLQAAAHATSLRIGMLVLNNDMRQPVLLAQELAAIDVATDGRLEIGLGAGWDRSEYDAIGLGFDPPGRRVDRLIASVAILKQAMAEGRVERAADSAYPQMSLADMPRSVQRPHPPILIGGGGPRVLGFAAREADIVGLDPRALPEGGHDPRDVTAEAIDRKVGWIRAAAGDRFAELDINVIVFGATDEGVASLDRADALTLDEVATSPHYLVGDAEAMNDQLLARRERWGINYLAIRPWQMDALEPVVSRLAGG